MLAHISLVPQYRDPDYPVTNGAYMIESESVKSIYLTKNPYYWQKNNVAFERVEYLPFIATKLSDFDVVLDVPEVHADLQHFPQLCSYFYEFISTILKLLRPMCVRRLLRWSLSPIS